MWRVDAGPPADLPTCPAQPLPESGSRTAERAGHSLGVGCAPPGPSCEVRGPGSPLPVRHGHVTGSWP